MASSLRKSNRGGVSFFAFQDIITSVTGILILVTLVLTLYVNNPSAVSEETVGAPEQLTEEIEQAESMLNALQAENVLRQRLISVATTSPDASRLEAEIQTFQEQIQQLQQEKQQVETESQSRQVEVKELAQKFGLPELEAQVAIATNIVAQLQVTNSLLETELEATREKLEEVIKQRNKLWLVPDAAPNSKENLLVVISSAGINCERFGHPEGKQTFTGPGAITQFSAALQGWDKARTHLVFYLKPSGIPYFQTCLDLAKRAGFSTGHDAVEEQMEILFAPPGEQP